jgi:hypothetical protein
MERISRREEMRKLGVLSLALIVGLLVAAGSSFAATHTVPTDFATITLAIAASSNGDIIKVLPGLYVEDVVVNKGLKIMSTGGSLKTFVQATSFNNSAFWVIANNVTISGFTIWGGSNNCGIFIGTFPATANNVKIQNCIVEKSGVGILVYKGASQATITKNQIRYCTFVNGGTNKGVGIYVVSDGPDISNVIISNNQIVDNDGYGIMVYGSAGTPSFPGMQIAGNTLVNNGALDFIVPDNHNWNLAAIGFSNAYGTITLNHNKIQHTNLATEINVESGTPTLVGSGNLKYFSCTKSVAGPPTALPVP